jgi:thiosulfate dehydrogenase [quinone] large subunit
LSANVDTGRTEIPESNLTRFLFADTRMAPFWFVVRVYLGYLWLMEGIGKVTEGGWIGQGAGGAVKGFAQGAMAQTTGEHPQVTQWYASFLENVVIPNATLFSYLVTFGEILVGLALILGMFTGIAAFFGAFMNCELHLRRHCRRQPAYDHTGHPAHIRLAGRRVLGT